MRHNKKLKDEWYFDLLFKFGVVWLLFNFLLLLFKLNNLDHDKIPAWRFMKYVWYFDVFLFWIFALVAICFILSIVYSLITELNQSKKENSLDDVVKDQITQTNTQRPEDLKLILPLTVENKSSPLGHELATIEPQKNISMDSRPVASGTQQIKLKPQLKKTKSQIRQELLNDLIGKR